MFNTEKTKMEPLIEFINPVIKNISQQEQLEYVANIDPEIQRKIEIGLKYLNDLKHPKFSKVLELYPFDANNFSEEQFKNIEKGYNYIGSHTYEFFGKYADQQDLISNYVNQSFLLWYFLGALVFFNCLRIIFILLFDKQNREKEYRGGFGGALERGLRGIAVGSLWYPVVYPDTLNRFYKTIYHAFPNLYVGQYVLFRHFPGNTPLEYFDKDKYLGLVPTTSYLYFPDPKPHIVKVVFKTPKMLLERWSGTEILQDHSTLGQIWKFFKNLYIWLFVVSEPSVSKVVQQANVEKNDNFIDWFTKDTNFYSVTSQQFYLFTEKIKNLFNKTHFNYNDLPESINRFNFSSDFQSRILDLDLAKWKSINENDEFIKFLTPFFKGLNLTTVDDGQFSIPLQGNQNYLKDIKSIQDQVNQVFQNEANFELNRLKIIEQDYQIYLKNVVESNSPSGFSLYKIYHLIVDPLLTILHKIFDIVLPYLWIINNQLDIVILNAPNFIKSNLLTVFTIVTFSYVLRRGRYYLGRLFRYYLGHTIILEMLSRFVVPLYYSYYKWVEESSFILLSDQANNFTKFLYYYKDTHRDEFSFTADALGWSILALPILLFISSQFEQYFYVKYLTDSALIHIGTRRPGEGD